MTYNLTTELKEGNKIMRIDAQDDNAPEYTIIKSSEDGELYGFYQKDIIKIDEADLDKYIVTDLFNFEDEREYIEVELDDDKSKFIKYNGEGAYDAIYDAMRHNDHHAEDDGYIDIRARFIVLTGEEYWRRTWGENCIEFQMRDAIKSFYDNAVEIDDAVRRIT